MRSDIVPVRYSRLRPPDETGKPQRLSDLQGNDDLMVLHPAGRALPRERQCIASCSSSTSGVRSGSHRWSRSCRCQHETSKLKISTGANWTFLADEDLHVPRRPRHSGSTPTRTTPRTWPYTMCSRPVSSSTSSIAATGFWDARRSTTSGPICATCRSASHRLLPTRPAVRDAWLATRADGQASRVCTNRTPRSH